MIGKSESWRMLLTFQYMARLAWLLKSTYATSGWLMPMIGRFESNEIVALDFESIMVCFAGSDIKQVPLALCSHPARLANAKVTTMIYRKV